MKIISGIVNLKEAKAILPYSDEIYFGVSWIGNYRKWYKWQNINDFKDAYKIITMCVNEKKPIYLAANEIYLDQERGKIISEIEKMYDIGLTGIIARDINLIYELKSKLKKIKINLSSTAICFNSESVDFFKQFGISRITIPQHILSFEWEKVLKRHSDIDYEFFYFLDCYCPNVDGICIYHNIEPNNRYLCKYPLYIGSEKVFMKIPDMMERFSRIYDLSKMKIKYIKLSRDGALIDKINNLKNIKLLDKIVKISSSRNEYMERINNIVKYGKSKIHN